MRRLHTAIQRYAWGKGGSDSMVAQLKKTEDPDFNVDEEETYAELWMGTHPNGPSRVMRDGNEGAHELDGLYGSPEGPGMFLIELLETYPHYLGDQENVGDLPFMFKVLSINKALSIQAHPDKKLAERLYATRPDLYKDDNHKPEMAVALSDFEGLCGFRPFREIINSLEAFPELRAAIGVEATAQALSCTSGVKAHEEEALRSLFRAFVTANTDVVSAQVAALVERLEFERSPDSEVSVDQSLCGSGEGHRHSPDSCGDDSSYDGFAYGGQCNSITDHILGRRSSRKQRHTDRFIGEGVDCGDVAVLEIHREELSELSEIDRKITLADGGSDDTVDGVTDQEDLHTEDDSSRPQSTSDASCHGNIKGTALWDKQQQQQQQQQQHQQQQPVVGKPSAGTAYVTRRRGAASSFLRRGWSSSAKSFVDIKGDRSAREDHALRELILRLSEEYPGDIGIMMPLLLNYLRMGKGESFFMAANEPHAYLKGDILEVMARSDNVVRVALTPKHRDVPLLCEILTYGMGAPPIVQPVVVDDFCCRYTPPIQDFEMLDIEIPPQQEYSTEPASVAALAIVLTGSGSACDGSSRQKLCGGVAFFVPARTSIVYASTGTEGLWLCLARSNLNRGGGEESYS